MSHEAAVLSQAYLGHLDDKMAGVSIRNGTSDDKPQLRPAQSVDELKFLALSADLAGFEFTLTEIDTLLYTIQELRHNSVKAEDGPDTALDDALVQINNKLEEALQEHERLAERVDHDKSNESDGNFFQQKLASLTLALDRVQKDVEVLKDEFSEDKWLVVFRTVSAQATDMMDSLDKIVSACQTYIEEINRHPLFASTSTSYVTPPRRHLNNNTDEEMQTLLQQFITLHRTLHAKRKYYDPSTARVLNILDKGIGERSTTNGEVLRRYSDMKMRYNTLQKSLDKADKDMQSVQGLFSDVGESQQTPQQPLIRASMASPASEKVKGKQKAVLKHKRSSTFSGTNLLTPPSNAPSKGPIGRSVSPFRKLANRMSLSGSSVATSVSSSPKTRNRSDSGGTNGTSELGKVTTAMAKQTLMDHPPAIGQRRTSLRPDWLSRSANPSRSTASSFRHPSGSSHISSSSRLEASPQASKLRSKSPFGGSEIIDFKPKWNASTKRDAALDDPFDVLGTPSGRAKASANTPHRRGFSRPLSPHFNESQNALPHFDRRVTMPVRPSSPALSATSAATSPAVMGSPGKRRPSSPSTRIPMPSSQIRRKFSGASDWNSNFGDDGESASSLLQRTMSPGPSHFGGYSLQTGTKGTDTSDTIYRRQIEGNDLEVLDINSANNSPTTQMHKNGDALRQTLFTPEPMMRAQAARVNNMTRRSLLPKPNGTPSRPTTPQSRYTPSRAASGLGFYTDGVSSSQYRPNAYDQLDLELAKMVNSQIVAVYIERVDLPLTKIAGQSQTQAQWTAQYRIGSPSNKPVQLKLVERTVGGVLQRKVLAKVGGNFRDLGLLLLDMQAHV